jgi:hypothetical protein
MGRLVYIVMLLLLTITGTAVVIVSDCTYPNRSLMGFWRNRVLFQSCVSK